MGSESIRTETAGLSGVFIPKGKTLEPQSNSRRVPRDKILPPGGCRP